MKEKNKSAQENIFNLPNLLTLIRLLLLPLFAFFAVNRKPLPAAILIVIIGLLDVADGYIARKFSATKFGAVFDMAVDAVTQVSVFLILIYSNYLPLLALIPLGIFVASGIVSCYLFFRYNFGGRETTFLAHLVGVVAYILIIASLFNFYVVPLLVIETILVVLQVIEYYK